MVHILQRVRSTKPCIIPSVPATTPSPLTPDSVLPSGERRIWEEPIRKLSKDNKGHFSILSWSGNIYLLLAYQRDCNIILVKYFCSKNDRHCIDVYRNIRQCIQQHNHKLHLQILNNEDRADYCRTIREDEKKRSN